MNNIQVTLMGKSNCNATAFYKENYVIQVVCLNMCQAILSDISFNNNINSSCIKSAMVWKEKYKDVWMHVVSPDTTYNITRKSYENDHLC